MTTRPIDETFQALQEVRTSAEFRGWVKHRLRRCLPHASVLATFGKLYGPGSVPTHRIEVDFPLHLLEELKTIAGALNDPSLHAWFRDDRYRYIDLTTDRGTASSPWRDLLLNYGARNLIVHGLLDHEARRFAVFQFFNVFDAGSPEVARSVRAVVPSMTRAGWTCIEGRSSWNTHRVVGHPTVLLTQAEIQIIGLLAQGLSNKEIARRRGVSDSTVKTQVQRTGAKLGATRRAEIVALAMPLLTPLPPQGLIDYDDGY